jgi:drug/metabolite transporter (DMT)-like permease
MTNSAVGKSSFVAEWEKSLQNHLCAVIIVLSIGIIAVILTFLFGKHGEINFPAIITELMLSVGISTLIIAHFFWSGKKPTNKEG